MTEQPASELIEALLARGWRVATAESLTGGLVAANITAVAGSSAVFLGGIVAYATQSKQDVLGVPGDLLDRHGPIADSTALAMASAAGERFGADLGIATTGVAGPGPAAGEPPGTVFVAAVLSPVGGSEPTSSGARRLTLDGDRATVRAGAVQGALACALELLRTSGPERE